MPILMLTDKIRIFNEERNWSCFHTSENLAKAISIEANELLECFLWEPANDINKIKEEVADIFVYLLMFCDKNDIDLLAATNEKIEINKNKYPIQKAYNNCKKYTEL